MKTKTTKTYSIENSVYSAFDILASDKNINKSSFIVECIKKLLKENNINYIDKLYTSRSNPDVVVTVISQDDTYYYLNDGSKIQIILFMQNFKEYESVNPDNFFNKSKKTFEKIVNDIKNSDNEDVRNGETDIDASVRKMLEEKEIEDAALLKKLRDKINSGVYDNK